jgi:molecular chaperone GrpE (heat shock protein)
VNTLDPERRQQMVEAIAAWLNDLTEAEPPPPGLAPEVMGSSEPAPDLFSMLSQLTALTRETQLQGRATSRLHAELSATLTQLTATSPETVARKLVDARREARLELITELLDVRDRFTRGLTEAQRRLESLQGIRAYFGQRPVLEALVEGNLLARERFDDLLRRLEVQEIACVGRPFDPTVMRAVEVVQAPDAAPGTVLDVFRPGYTSNGRVLRAAEVKVVGGMPSATGEQDHG